VVAALNEAPEEVLEYLEFLVGRYDTIWKPFKVIDGPDGNGLITLREFEPSFSTMKCKKFEGPDEKQKIERIFRYLDPSGEGSVSEGEWGVMELLWKEMMTSIGEFVSFLDRAFGDDDDDEDGKDFLEEAFKFLDEDGTGSIDKNEWCDAIVRKLKYFGPSRVIFNFLDKDDEGTIGIDEFNGLRGFHEAKE